MLVQRPENVLSIPAKVRLAANAGSCRPHRGISVAATQSTGSKNRKLVQWVSRPVASRVFGLSQLFRFQCQTDAIFQVS